MTANPFSDQLAALTAAATELGRLTDAVDEASQEAKAAEHHEQQVADQLEDAIVAHWVEHHDLPITSDMYDLLFWDQGEVLWPALRRAGLVVNTSQGVDLTDAGRAADVIGLWDRIDAFRDAR